MDKPRLLALLVDALLVECAVKTVMSIPARPKKSLTYLAIVTDFTGLCGYAYDKTTFAGDPSKFSRISSVLCLYSSMQFTIQIFWLSG